MVLIEVQEIAVGDYSDEYGTIDVAEIQNDDTIHLHFINNTELFLPKETELMIDQGGRFNHGIK